jgi:hypothetical protein
MSNIPKKIIHFLRKITRKPKGTPTIPRRMVTWLCEHTGGHEQLPGDVGYAGGSMLDVWCKHCDMLFQVPVREKNLSKEFRGLMNILEKENEPPL